MIVRLLLPLVLGIVMADHFYEPLHPYSLQLLGGAFVLCLIAFVLRHRCHEWIFTCLIGTATSLVGATLLINDRNTTEQTTWSDQPQTYTLTQLTHIKSTPKTFRIQGYIREREVVLTLHRDSLSQRPVAGSSLWVHTTISHPNEMQPTTDFDYGGFLKRQGIAGVGFCSLGNWIVCTEPSHDSSLRSYFLRWRDQALSRLSEHFPEATFSLLSTMTLGEKSHISKATLQLFSDTGASHILALSGLHLSILYGFVVMLLSQWLRGRLRLHRACSLGLLPLIWLFVGIAGAPPSLVRSATMLSLLEVCRIYEHERSSLNHLCIAALVILLCAPQSLFQVSFQLSFAAVAGIIGFHPLIKQRFELPFEPTTISETIRSKVRNYLRDLLYVSLAAQVATCLIIGYYFHSFPVYGLLVNLIVVPLATLILPLSLLFFILPFAAPVLSPALQFLVGMLTETLGFFSHLPQAVLNWEPSVLTVVSGSIALFIVAYRLHSNRSAPHLIAVGATALIIAIVSTWM